MPDRLPLRRSALFALLLLLLTGAAALAVVRTTTGDEGPKLGANGCPTGFASREERITQEARELASERTRSTTEEDPDEERLGGDVGAGGPLQRIADGPECVNRRAPESRGELMTVQTDDAKRSTGGVASSVKPGAYRAAVNQRSSIAAASGDLPGSAGSWKPAGSGPLISDDPRFGEVNGLGLADLAGRISDFAYDPGSRRVFAAVGEGGVWQSDDLGATWRSIGDPLPTQAIGGIAFSPADGGTVIVTTGDSVFGGGGTFAGVGAYRTTDGGRTWQKSAGVPDGVITFKVAVDPTDPRKVYAGTGAGLYRSTDAGATFTNVALPTGKAGGRATAAALEPDCTGAPSTRAGCFQANMVTDVVVQGADNEQTPDGSPGAKGGAVVATVGWRAGDKKSPARPGFPTGYVESPNNGVYRSDDGAPGSFDRIDSAMTDFGGQNKIGRIELGLAEGPKQDHNYLYAIVQDAGRFNGQPGGIDVPEGSPALAPNNTALNGIFVSDDFGDTWTRMAEAEQLKDPSTGSALTGTACATQYCPGIQAWYNEWVKPDPTAQTASGVPTRVTFGLEEIWQNRTVSQPQNGPTQFKVVGPYFSGESCLFLTAAFPACPTTAGDPLEANLTVHPDHHSAIYVPTGDGKAKLLVGHDGGVNAQDVTSSADVDPDGWGRGANAGFNTLLPYDAQIAKDNTIYAGLQDNGELKIQPDGKQFMTFGGDGAFSAVDPDDSKITYEGLPGGTINKSTNGGESYTDASPGNGDTFIFINPFTMDPLSAKHLITAGNRVTETDDGAANWTDVFTFGKAPSGANYAMTAIDTRSVPSGGAPSGGAAKVTPNVPEYTGGQNTVPGAGVGSPATTSSKTFTIAPDETNASATILIKWANQADDWDLRVTRREGNSNVEVGSSASGDTTSEQVVLSSPPPGEYTIQVDNFAARPGTTFTGSVVFAGAQGNQVGEPVASYAAFCGVCDTLNTPLPFDNGIATNVTRDAGGTVTLGKKLKADNWHRAKAEGLPKRLITSVQVDPVDPATVYVTLAGYSRRWLPVGAGGEAFDPRRGNVFKSTDAGETFKDISGNLPDVPANWSVVRNGQLVVGTNVGTFIAPGTDGGSHEVLGSGLPTAPVFTLELKPKASPSEVDTLIAATQGRGVYRYEFKDPVKAAGTGERAPGQTRPATSPGGLTACAASAGFARVSASGSGRSAVNLSFTRRVSSPVQVDVFRVSEGRRVVRERLVARFANKTRSFRWNGVANRGAKRRVGTGYYFVRYTMLRGGKRFDVRRVVLRRAGGKFSRRPDYYRRATCDLLNKFKLERPVFGGPRLNTLKAAYRLSDAARVTVTITKGSKVVKRYKAVDRAGKRTYRITLPARRRSVGDYRIRLQATSGRDRVNTVLTSRRL